VALDGSAPKPRFADFAGRSPSVSRDGTRIVYLSGGAGGPVEGAGRGGRGGRQAAATAPTTRHGRRCRPTVRFALGAPHSSPPSGDHDAS
jgi:hypothetical protein